VEGTRVYRLTIRGRLTARLAPAFDGMRVEQRAATTDLVGPVADSAQLYGLINRLRDFGLELVRVEEVVS
jgi:hypothetical protein